MRHHSDRDPHDALNDYLDAFAGAPPPAARAGDLDPGMRDGVDRFFDLAERAGMAPAGTRRRTMNATMPASTPLAPPKRKSRRSVTRPGWTRHLNVVSTALLLVVVTALFGVLVARQLGPIGPDDRSPAGTANQGLYDPDDLSTYPRVPQTCEPNGEVTSDADLAQHSIGDWPTPEYTPAKVVAHERGLAIQETYLVYLRCQYDAFTSATPTLNASGTPTIPRSPEMLSYYSDRMRYMLLDGELSPGQHEALEAYRCRPRTEELLASWPLPVNQPEDYAILSLLPQIDEIDKLASIFSPSDVYLMPDGRYGAIIGTISTAALKGPTELTLDDHLTFVAFVEDDGRYLIDEMFLVVGPDRDQPIVGQAEDGSPRNAVLYHPIESDMCEPPAE